MWLAITFFSLLILHSVYLLLKKRIKGKKEATKRNVPKYQCPVCGAELDESQNQIQVTTKDIVWFWCGNCFSSGNARTEDVMNKPIEIEKISNKDSIKDWDLSSAKDVEFTKVTETFNRKSDLD